MVSNDVQKNRGTNIEMNWLSLSFATQFAFEEEFLGYIFVVLTEVNLSISFWKNEKCDYVAVVFIKMLSKQ